jgi:hypothetical protein
MVGVVMLRSWCVVSIRSMLRVRIMVKDFVKMGFFLFLLFITTKVGIRTKLEYIMSLFFTYKKFPIMAQMTQINL